MDRAAGGTKFDASEAEWENVMMQTGGGAGGVVEGGSWLGANIRLEVLEGILNARLSLLNTACVCGVWLLGTAIG